MQRKWHALVAAATAVACLLGGCGKKAEDTVVARVGGVSITQSDLAERLSELPDFAQRQFAGPMGSLELLNNMVDEEVLYQAARQAGYEKDPETVKLLEAMKRRSMIQAYYRNEIEGKTEVGEEDIAAYYDEHVELFHQRARIKFRHIMAATRDAAADARRRVLAGETFDDVARAVSTDARTKAAGGLMSSVHLGDALPDIGMDAAFIEKLFGWKIGETTDPLRSEKGWHVIRIEEKQEAGRKPLDEVRDLIAKNLKPAKTRERYESILEQLKAKYRVKVNEEVFKGAVPSEEALFTRAQQTTDVAQRLDAYLQIVMEYPDGQYADDAQFMIGFIQSEELRDYEAATNAFRRLLQNYPNSELGESARWMLENMGKEAPPFEEPGKSAKGR
ncbi:MAG: peptidyl-prolyl cis-trans isomerase [Candidatus Eisenbacteria bacterium]|nr:peptidyl-prolyl cis-trans isomerase [Candidatus Eisenbacteria bacterium]